jgi:hypothetical protein
MYRSPGRIDPNEIAMALPAVPAAMRLLLMIVVSATAIAQVPEFSDTLRGETFVARSERFASTQSTSLSTDYHLRTGMLNGFVRSHLLSSTTLLGDPATKDQVDLVVDLDYLLPGSMRLFTLTEGTLTNDVRGGGTLVPGLNNTGALFTGVGARFFDDDSNRIGMAVGGAYNRQLNVEDAGGGFYGEAIARTNLSEYNVSLDARARWYNIAPRHNSNGYLDLRVERDFPEGGRGDLSFRYDLINTDNYVRRQDAAGGGDGLTYDGVQARREGRVQMITGLQYAVGDDLGLDLHGLLSTGAIGQRELSEGLPPLPRDPDPFLFQRDELTIGASIGMIWSPRRTRLTLRLDYLTNEEENSVEPNGTPSELELKKKRETSAQNDFISQQLLLGGTAEYRLTSSDTIFLNGSVGIYRYDTPSLTNYFDKDEQSIQWQLRYARSFSRLLAIDVTAQAFLTHLVYLSGQNSNDNNWNRIFRLAPTVQYSLDGKFQNRLEAEVYANYTAYDFEGRTQNLRGRSFREIHLRDSLSISLARQLMFATRGDLRISERGSFSWEQFAESLLERIRTEGLDAELLTSRVPGVLFGVGGRLSRVKSFRIGPAGDLLPSSDRISIGPTANLQVALSEMTYVICHGWWEHVFDEGELASRNPSLFITVGVRM